MAQDYDPDSFAVRVSQDLFNVLTGRAAEPGLIEPRTPREAALIDAVRKEAQYNRSTMLQEVKKDQLKELHEREQAMNVAVSRSATELEDKLNALNFPKTSAGNSPKPCASFRTALTTCYRVNGKENPLACAGEVEAFTECAKLLSRTSN